MARPSLKALKVCKENHGGESNAATVYGHYGRLSRRVCIRLYGTNTWIYDPRWENPPAANTNA